MVKITALFVASALVAVVSAAPVAEKRQINFGSGNGIGNGNFQFNPPACKRLAPGNYGSGNVLGSGNGIVCTREQEEEWSAIEKRQINFGSGNGIGNGNFGVRPCKRLAPGNYGSGNQIGGDNGILCTRDEDAAWAEFNKRQINFGSGNSIGDGNFQFTPPKGGLPAPPSLPKRQTNGGSGNSIGNGNFGVRPCKRLAPGGGNFLSGNSGGNDNGIVCTREEDAAWAELEKRQTNVGSGNAIGNGNFQFNPASCKRQLNFGSGNVIGGNNGIVCP